MSVVCWLLFHSHRLLISGYLDGAVKLNAKTEQRVRTVTWSIILSSVDSLTWCHLPQMGRMTVPANSQREGWHAPQLLWLHLEIYAELRNYSLVIHFSAGCQKIRVNFLNSLLVSTWNTAGSTVAWGGVLTFWKITTAIRSEKTRFEEMLVLTNFIVILWLCSVANMIAQYTLEEAFILITGHIVIHNQFRCHV